MCKIAIVGNNENFVSPLSKALPAKVEYKLLSTSEAESQFSQSNFRAPDLLILDLETTDQPARRLVANLGHRHSNVTVIVIVPAENPFASEMLAVFGIDEIIVRPADEEQQRQMIERLVLRISTYNRVFAVQEKLRKEMRQREIVLKSKPMREIVQRLSQLAVCTSTVLITGETGTGKELFARAIHYLGPRAGQPFITVDCGTMPEQLAENELFGHVRGAYTDAAASSKGLVQEADGGTLFLDEIEALPFIIQSKFLRFLQEREYKPLGQTQYVSVDIRVLVASNIDLATAVAKKNFREDLYYRLNVVPLFIPPLRERKADIPALVHFFLHRYTSDQATPPQIPEETLQSWMRHDWPGNVRELENKVQQWLAVASAANQQEAASVVVAQPIRAFAEARGEALAQFERTYLHRLLAHTKGNLSAAARLAETDRKHLRTLLRKCGLTASHFRF